MSNVTFVAEWMNTVNLSKYTNATTILAQSSIVFPRLSHLDLEVLVLHLPILQGKQPYLKSVVNKL